MCNQVALNLVTVAPYIGQRRLVRRLFEKKGTRALITTSPLAQEAPKTRSLKPRPIGTRRVPQPATVEPAMIDPKLVELVQQNLDDSKAEDIISIDLVGKTSIADVMVIASGRSDRHVGAIADHLIQTLKDKGYETPRVEGMPQCDWVLIDAGDMIVHVFKPEVRQFYNLEKIWGSDRPKEAFEAH